MKETNKEENIQSYNVDNFPNQNKVSDKLLLRGVIALFLILCIILFGHYKVKSQKIEITNTYKENIIDIIPFKIDNNSFSKQGVKETNIVSEPYDLLSMCNNIKDIRETVKEIEAERQKKLKEEKEELIKNSFKKYVSSSNGLNVRNREWQIIKTLPFNSEVTILIENATEDNEWDIILYNDEYCYINNKSLSKEKVKEVTLQYNDFKGSNVVYLGTFSSTAYCACSKCCGKWASIGKTASGTRPTQGRTIAVDPRVIPLGSKVIINGRTYIAEDTGSAIKGKKIDIFYSSHRDALNWGRRNIEVYIVR